MMISELVSSEMLRKSAAFIALLVCIALIIANKCRGKKTSTAELISAGGTGAAIPSIILMMLAIEDPNLYVKFPDLTTLGAIGGITILYTFYNLIQKHFPQRVEKRSDIVKNEFASGLDTKQ